MQVKVTLLGAFRDKLPSQNRGKTTLSLPDGTTVAEVVAHFKLASTIASAIGGTQVDKSQVLQDGDEVQLFRQLGGG